MLDRINKIKEYFNINGYYLRLHLTNQLISLISYNSNKLNGIKYESKINSDEIKRNNKIKNLTVQGLYELIHKKINEKKIIIQGDENCVTLTLLENIAFNSNNDIQLTLVKNNRDYINEYEKILSNVIMNLKEENKNIKNELNEIKKILYKNNDGLNINQSYRPTSSKVKLLKRQLSKQNNISKSLNSSNHFKNSYSNQLFTNSSKNPLSNEISYHLKESLSEPISYKEKKKSLNNILNQIDSSQGKIINKDNNYDIFEEKIIDQQQINHANNNFFLKQINDLNISSLANLEYGLYPPVELSTNSFNKISGYGANSYNGIAKNYNEDRIKVILNYKLNKTNQSTKGNITSPNISYFGLYDGHGGNKCSNFLQEKLHTFLFNSDYFPLYTLQAIYEAYSKAEQEFQSIAFDSQKNILLDKSGSCSISIIIIDEWCYVTNLGDSRALFSFDSGKFLFQISRDHKPQDFIERVRIEKYGGRIYKDTRIKVNGQKIHVKEKDMPGFIFPYRVSPGNLSVSFYINFF